MELPFMICQSAIDHPFLLQPKDLVTFNVQINPLERCKVILEAAEKACFGNDNDGSRLLNRIRIALHKTDRTAGEYGELINHFQNWLSKKTGLSFNFAKYNKSKDVHSIVLGKTQKEYYNTLFFDPLMEKTEAISARGVLRLEKVIDLFAMKGGIPDLISQYFLGAGCAIKDDLVLLVSNKAPLEAQNTWCNHFCMNYIKDSLIYSKEVVCPIETGYIKFVCPLKHPCAMLTKVKALKKSFDSQELT